MRGSVESVPAESPGPGVGGAGFSPVYQTMSPLNVGIIGFGRIGAEHSDWIAAARGVAAVAVADATPARRSLPGAAA